jgi:hypothetical protein
VSVFDHLHAEEGNAKWHLKKYNHQETRQ